MKRSRRLLIPVLALVSTLLATSVQADTCKQLPSYGELKQVFLAVLARNDYGGNGHPPWMTLIDGSGIVCAVVTSLINPDVTTNMSGLGHRILSAHKANTSTIYSHDRIALSSGNFYALTLPGGQLFGTTLPAMVNVSTGDPATWGTPEDPMVGKRVGGFSALAGGLPLFNSSKHKVGAIGVSGNPFCTAHVVAWKVREMLADGAYTRANLPGGPAHGGTDDAIIYDFTPDPEAKVPSFSPSGFGYPVCDSPPPAETDDGAIERR